MYIFLYFLPLFLVGGVFAEKIPFYMQLIFSTLWTFVGLVIIAAISGYFSTGVTLWEPVIASTVLVLLIPLSQTLYTKYTGLTLPMPISDYTTLMVVVFVLSFLGAWLGEHLQGSFHKKEKDMNDQEKNGL
jgi:type III secretory pathway component EscS